MGRTVRYLYRDVLFEWDEVKATANLLEHGVAFQT